MMLINIIKCIKKGYKKALSLNINLGETVAKANIKNVMQYSL